jgi:hypothetical protein
MQILKKPVKAQKPSPIPSFSHSQAEYWKKPIDELMDIIDFTASTTAHAPNFVENLVQPAQVQVVGLIGPTTKESNSKKRRRRAKKIQQQEAEKLALATKE